MITIPFLLVVVALILLVVALITHLTRTHGGLALPLTIVAGICISVALLIGWMGVGYVHFAPVR